jgi:hypothetical protein
MPDFSFFEFYTSEVWAGERLNIRCRYGGDPDTTSGGTTASGGFIQTKGGGGVWETVKRPYLPPLTVWRGPTDAYQHTIPALLDGWHDGNDVEQAVEEIEKMCGLELGVVPDEPPLLVLNGYGAIPHDVTSDPHLRWVIPQPPEWGEPTRDERTGKLVRQAFTITFMVWNTDLTLVRQTHKAAKHRHISAKAGDTFESIAAHRLKHPNWGTRLANLNNHQNAREHLHQSQQILLPTSDEERQWERSRRR